MLTVPFQLAKQLITFYSYVAVSLNFPNHNKNLYRSDIQSAPRAVIL